MKNENFDFEGYGILLKNVTEMVLDFWRVNLSSMKWMEMDLKLRSELARLHFGGVSTKVRLHWSPRKLLEN